MGEKSGDVKAKHNDRKQKWIGVVRTKLKCERHLAPCQTVLERYLFCGSCDAN